MGTCINIFGIPILEDRQCRAARLRKRNERIETTGGGGLLSFLVPNPGNVATRQDGRTARKELDAQRDVLVANQGFDPSGLGSLAGLGTLGAAFLGAPAQPTQPTFGVDLTTGALVAAGVVGFAYFATR